MNTVPGPGAQTVAEDGTLAFSGGTLISVADNDNNLASTILSVANGVLNVTAGGATVTGNGTGALTITGLQTNINTALASLDVRPAADHNGTSATTTGVSSYGKARHTATVATSITPAADAAT